MKRVVLLLSAVAIVMLSLGAMSGIGHAQTAGGFADVSAAGDNSLAIKSDGSAWAWGDGEGTDYPVWKPGLSGSTDIATGPYHGLALMSDATVWAWGDNDEGQLGFGIDQEWTDDPVQVKGPNGEGFLNNVKAIAAGSEHSVALKEDGTVWVWGNNYYGQAGDGTSGQFEDQFTPVQVKGPNGEGFLTGVKSIAAGAGYTVALKDDGTVWAWGYYILTGQGCCSNSSTPVQVKGPGGQGYLTGITDLSVASDGDHALALKDDGTVWAWGYNYKGQLGDGTTNDSRVPVQVKGENGQGTLTGVNEIAAGGDYEGHSLAIKDDGTAWAWGYNGAGQLGDGTFENKTTPVQVKGQNGQGFLANVTELVAGENHTLAVTGDGKVWGWGYDEYGQLGDRVKAIRTPTPVQPVFAANNAPQVFDEAPPEDTRTTDRTPSIGATVSDYETNLAKSNITLKVEYSAVPRSAFKYDATTDSLTYTPPRKKRLSYGYTDVQVIAKDPQGLIGKENWYFYIDRP